MKRLMWFFLVTALLASPLLASASERGKVDPDQVRQELRQILSAPEYDHTVKMNWFDRIVTSVGDFIRNTLGRLWQWLLSHLIPEGSSARDIAATVGAWLVLAAFLVLLWFVVKRLIRNYGGRAPRVKDPEDARYDMPSAKPLLKQAAKLAEQGDFRAAFQAAYVACIAYLDEIRAVRFERSRTNWEYLQELKQGGHEKPYEELHPLTQQFDRKIYGREACGDQDYQSAVSAYQRLSGEEAK